MTQITGRHFHIQVGFTRITSFWRTFTTFEAAFDEAHAQNHAVANSRIMNEASYRHVVCCRKQHYGAGTWISSECFTFYHITRNI